MYIKGLTCAGRSGSSREAKLVDRLVEFGVEHHLEHILDLRSLDSTIIATSSDVEESDRSRNCRSKCSRQRRRLRLRKNAQNTVITGDASHRLLVRNWSVDLPSDNIRPSEKRRCSRSIITDTVLLRDQMNEAYVDCRGELLESHRNLASSNLVASIQSRVLVITKRLYGRCSYSRVERGIQPVLDESRLSTRKSNCSMLHERQLRTNRRVSILSLRYRATSVQTSTATMTHGPALVISTSAIGTSTIESPTDRIQKTESQDTNVSSHNGRGTAPFPEGAACTAVRHGQLICVVVTLLLL